MKILIKGAGDLATGTACRLHKCGMQIIMTDLPIPTAVRRTVSFSRAVYEGTALVEGSTAVCCASLSDAEAVLDRGDIAVIPDPEASFLASWKPDAVVDAILAKHNTGTRIADAPIVIALGPGFCAGVDCHAVIETKRGHDLGRCIYEGTAIPNTGIPGDIGGYTVERLLRAPCAGVFSPVVSIGTIVKKDDICAYVDGVPMVSRIDGVVRGLLQPGVTVFEGMKAGDVDPRCEVRHCYTVSDKARSIGGGVLEALLTLQRQKGISAL
ncbi:MAG: EF2563 family selenium-dependent molybdenum hydroxylase system protein [Clostridia bacterium]|nr:EF2563 family selenium-dependent molybdenum hydroxylase system protein [Clostridia bacterium]